MEFDNIENNPRDHETHFYVNTTITTAATQKCAGQSKQNKMEKDEGQYEHLSFERKVLGSTPTIQEDTIKMIKVIGSIFSALLIALYIGVVALVIVISVPKEQDGGWSNWESWSSCSDTCGGGIKSRNRSCSNPTPSLYGKQCIGNFEKVSLCNKQMCPGTDGGWSNWEIWSSCTESCGGGITSRNRSCSNPSPSLYGKQCMGHFEQVSLCNKQLCPGTDGGWSVWEDWGTCTDSCGGGVRTRSRSCTNPTPSMTGRHCTGDYTDVSTCNKKACPEHIVAFTAYDIHRNSSTASIIQFLNTHINIGDGYDTTTGKFTCNIPGVYHFVATLSKYYQDINFISVSLRINGSSKLYMTFNPKDDGSNEVGAYTMTGAGTFHLNQNDVVDVYGVPDYFYQYSYFTGFLITPDK